MKKVWLILAALMVASGNLYAQGGSAQQDSLALVAFYNATNGDNWTNNTNWLTGPVDTWFGVIVENDRVTGLLFNQNQLAGSIPAELGNLTNLTTLSLTRNQLTGSIPVELGNLTNLTFLALFANQLTGPIPVELGNLINLTSLSLPINQLTGSVPAELGDLTNLTFLSLGSNQLTGTIPVELSNLTNLTTLSLSANQLTGMIPVELSNLTNLRNLFLFSNQLTGTIPVELTNLTNLTELILSNNQLEGSIPVEIGNLSNLERLSLWNNQFDDLPGLAALTSLMTLSVQENELTFEDIEPNIGVASSFTYTPQANVGEAQTVTLDEGDPLMLQIPVGGASNQYQWFKDGSEIPNATSDTYTVASTTLDDAGVYTLVITNTVATALTLQSEPITVTVTPSVPAEERQALVALYNATDGDNWTNNTNWLTGPVDTWFGVTVEDGRVTRLNLESNQLRGLIPAELGNLTSLTFLLLRHNQLRGSLPVELGNLINLGLLDFQNNQLTGTIPLELGNLANLTSLNLVTNQFMGTIPPELGNLTNLTRLFLNQNQLTGSIPVALSNLTKLTNLQLVENELTGSIPVALSNLTNLTGLFLSNNQLTGTIPVELGNLTKLTNLDFRHNQLTGSIPAELGNLTELTSLSLFNNQLTGSIPVELGNLINLRFLVLSDNQFDDLPALTSLSPLDQLFVQNNQFTFEDIEPNIGVASSFIYAPQATVGEARTVTLNEGDPLTLQIQVGGASNQYQWFKDGTEIPNATTDTYAVASTTLDDAGVYTLVITNTVATALTLQSEPITVVIAEEQPSDQTFRLALAAETYRMISIPLRVADPGISSVLEDDYGPPDPEQWRLFRWRETAYDEHPNINAAFTPGTAFWLITRNGTGFDVENTLSVRTAQTITLEQGWNQIGNPFAFSVAWNTVTERSDIEGPWYFDGALNDYRPCCEPVIDPWEGYFVYNNTGAPFALVVEPVAAATARKTASSSSLLSESVYAVQMPATLAQRGWRDAQNYAALARQASEGRDALDFAEAPAIGDHVRLSLVEDGARLAGNYKPLGSDGQQWSIEVEAVVEGEVLPRRREVAVELIEHGERPAGWNLYVLDRDAGRILSRDGQRFAVTVENDVRHLSLILGTEAYAEAHSDGIALAPHEFALAQNYPNPFNPETMIEYSLAERTQVELAIYDVLGRRVRTLIDRVEESGTYAVRWRGRNDSGKPLASGVYVYRLKAGGFTGTRTMLLVR